MNREIRDTAKTHSMQDLEAIQFEFPSWGRILRIGNNTFKIKKKSVD